MNNFNYYLSQNNSSNVIGDFHWLKGVNTPLMTLHIRWKFRYWCYNSYCSFQVIGNTNIGGNAAFGGDINCTGRNFIGDLTR